MMGTVGILNVGAGDTKLTFDKNNPAECIRSGRIVTDMLRRGYALLIQLPDGSYTRVREFREDVCEYVIADLDPIQAAETLHAPAQPWWVATVVPTGRYRLKRDPWRKLHLQQLVTDTAGQRKRWMIVETVESGASDDA